MEQENTVTYDLTDFLDITNSKLHSDVPKGSPIKHPIREYTTKGEFIRIWNNVNILSKAFGVSYNTIRRCLRGKELTVKGRIFLDKGSTIKDRLALIKKEQERLDLIKSAEEAYTKACQINVYTSSGEFLRTCKDLKEASELYSIPKGTIYNHLTSSKSLVTKGLCFLRLEEDFSDRLKRIKNRKTHKKNL